MKTEMGKKAAIKEIVNMVDAIKLVSFVSARHTSKETGEVADYVLNVGIKHHTVLRRDLATLRALRQDVGFFIGLIRKYGEKVVDTAFAELEKSLEDSLNGTNKRASAMIDAFLRINSGIKLNLSTMELYLYGYKVSKKTVKKGVYKTVKSRPLTLCKNEITSRFKSKKYRTLRIDATAMFCTGGNRIEILTD